jgi:hypothetical protein
MRYDLYLEGKIKSLSPEKQEELEAEVRDYEECKEALVDLGIDPLAPNTTLLREAIFQRHYAF